MPKGAGSGSESVQAESSVSLKANSGQYSFLVRVGRARNAHFGLVSGFVLLGSLVWLGLRYWFMIDGENTISREALQKLAMSIKNTIQVQVQQDLIYQDQIANLWCAHPQISRSEFRRVVMSETYEAGLVTMTGISLIPRVVGPAGRTGLESSADTERLRQECCANDPATGSSCSTVAATGLFCGAGGRYQVTQFGSGGVLVPAIANDTAYIDRVGSEEYMVVDMIEPFETNHKVWGFNLLSSATRHQAWVTAMRTGKKTFTRRLNLVQSSVSEYGFLVWLPIFESADGQGWTTAMSGTVDVNLRAVGSVNGVYKAQVLLTRALESTYSKEQLEHVSVFLLDNAAELNGRSQFLAAYGDVGDDLYNQFGDKTLSDLRDDAEVSMVMDLAIDNSDAHWQVLVSSSDRYLAEKRTWYPEVALIIGALLLVTSTIDRWLGHPKIMAATIRRKNRQQATQARIVQPKRSA